MENYLVNYTNNSFDKLPTYKQFQLITIACFMIFSIGIITFYFKNLKDMILMYSIVILSSLVILVLQKNELVYSKEDFTDMPNPGINEIDSTFNKSFLSYHIKTAYDPHVQKSSKVTWALSAGSNKYTLDTSNLDYVLSRGVRGLCFSVVYANDEPRIVSGYFNKENKFVTHSSNYLSFYDVMYYLNENALSKTNTIPNYNDPLCIIIRLHSPQAENRSRKIASFLNNIFKTKLKDDAGNYLKLKEHTKLNTLKKKVLIFISNEGDENLDSKRQSYVQLDNIKFSNIGVYNKQNIQNSLTFANQQQPSLTVPAEDGLQNMDDCTLVTNDYFNNNIHFIAINYKLEEDSTKTCAYKYDQKFSSYGAAFIPQGI